MKVKAKRRAHKMLLIGAVGLLGIAKSYAQESDSARLAQLEENVSKLEVLNGFKVSGYFQGQFQYGQGNAALKVGSPNTDLNSDFNRIGIRRGRLKFSYEKGIATGVFQIDMTDKGIVLKDAYLQLKDLKYSASTFKVGVFNRPFGYEIERSSSLRESPERATVITTLFPEERDLGAMVSLQAKKTSPWNILKLDAGLFAGNGIKSDIKNRKDFIGHLSLNKSFNETIKVSGGVSYYNGSVYQGTKNIYRLQNNAFVVDSTAANKGKHAKREYFGFDAQFGAITKFGLTSISGEFITGTQPGDKTGSKSPNSATVGTSDTYIRNFSGGYVCLVQDFGKLPFSAVVKYDWYDPNTKVSKDQIGLNGIGKGDIAYQTTGLGLLWKINNNLRATAYYELVKNETSKNLTGYDKDIKDDVFTLRLQYKF
ncbi:MAG: hypothetical protein IT235_08020 [Bacteroidia bacterium]|nr:hypothetical protein [Bacteroidia bacterium]